MVRSRGQKGLESGCGLQVVLVEFTSELKVGCEVKRQKPGGGAQLTPA